VCVCVFVCRVDLASHQMYAWVILHASQALISYGLHFLSQRGFLPVQTPYWLQRDVMAQCAQLSQFDDELYRYVGVMALVYGSVCAAVSV